MGIRDLAKRDWQKYITSVSGAGDNLLIETPTGAPVAADINIRGLVMKHHLSFGTDGQAVNSMNAHITISESDLVAGSYPVRNAKNEVSLHKHKVTYTDSAELEKTYLIIQAFPDETVGVITCILANHE